MGTDPAGTVERNGRPARWFHAGVYVTVIVLLATGWWLQLGQEGRPSVLARATGASDAELHTVTGWVLAGLTALAAVVGARGWRTFWRESVRFHRGDAAWFRRWPAAIFTGRFGWHEGRFDPGQRIANLVLVVTLLALVVSGVGLALVSGGPAFVWFLLVHRWATYVVTPVVVGHVIIASGILPGYRGVWRAMHLGGHLRRTDATRVWPAWTDRHPR
ncbi:formate dehydrogenase subunit gamma [Promicromonospora umidemergens]|uniref:Cytochrome b561 bacterial/Ni-hydrogenase domain-containing protein n=1 Tax=Promicromonospora umidemergens TaxID=629679 RepID=A0ABP8X8V2_9MICO|nr:cytochrome b/b6 domain-containing protein [Promicromonospora umidemergens]MCP2281520.1 formate dehydrogenase subunit gamma [Promicromonospora umidemergens]